MKYWIDETSGVCVCKMSEEFDTPVHESDGRKSNLDHAMDYICGRLIREWKARSSNVYEWTSNDETTRLMVHTLLEPYVAPYIKDEYKGMAHCSAADAFDSERGIALARARCLTEFYRDIMEALLEVESALHRMQRIMREMEYKAEGSKGHWENTATELAK